VGPRAGLDRCRKSRPPLGFDPRTIQPVASRYTDYATRPTLAGTQGGFRTGYNVISINRALVERCLLHNSEVFMLNGSYAKLNQASVQLLVRSIIHRVIEKDGRDLKPL